MSPLARWCHRHRLAVVLAWVGLLTALGAAVGVGGSDFGDSPVAQNTDSARATALLREAASSAAGRSGRIVWQVKDGRVTDPTAERPTADAVHRIGAAPGVASVSSPFSPAGERQISADGKTAYATVAFEQDVSDTQTDQVKRLATDR
ncbi:MMPL family transporter [Streptomyces sp. NPDC006743]|uniref:MMPL family transporter n=1 Tax=Streptomyces sp. NPDC006743 TaxID=3154480 RepID=UPI0034511BCB